VLAVPAFGVRGALARPACPDHRLDRPAVQQKGRKTMTSPIIPSSLSRLAEQNDAFRKGLPDSHTLKGQRVHTRGVDAFGLEIVLDIWARVRGFDQFTNGNDPHGEHDFGSFIHPVAGKIFWKIDYYDRDYHMGSDDPCDPDQTRRVLTVLLAEEY
jgi:hypothetical protein